MLKRLRRPKPPNRRRRSVRFEQLEPRHLLNADTVIYQAPFSISFEIREDITGNGYDSNDPIADGPRVQIYDVRTYDTSALREEVASQFGGTHLNSDAWNDREGRVLRHGQTFGFELNCIRNTVSDYKACPNVVLSWKLVAGGNWFELGEEDISYLTGSSGISVEGIELRTFRYSVVFGQLFHDDNADGVRQPEEIEGIPDVRVTNQQTTGATGANGFTHSDFEGSYAVDRRGPSKHEHQIQVLIPSYRAPFPPGIKKFEITTLPEPFTIRSGTQTLRDIGMFEFATATGIVFNDANANGVQDDDEDPIEGATVFFDSNNDGKLGDFTHITCESITFLGDEPCVSTDADGVFLLPRGRYGDRLTVLPGTVGNGIWHLTNEEDLKVSSSGQIIDNVGLGFFEGVSVAGQLFVDVNQNGQFEHTVEPVVPRADVVIDLDNDGTIDGFYRTLDGEFGGAFTFSGVGPGTHRIIPSVSDITVMTTPSPPDGHIVTVPSSDGSSGGLIGLTPIGVKHTGAFVDAVIDGVPPDLEERDSEELQAKKKQLVEAIRLKIVSQAGADWHELRAFADVIISQDPSDAYIPVSLATLNLLGRIVDAQITITAERESWDDFYDLTLEDLDRLQALGEDVVSLTARLYSDSGYRQLVVSKGWMIAGAVADAVLREIKSIISDLDEQVLHVLLDTALGSLSDAVKLETWQRIVSDLLAFESFKKAFLDPTVQVEARIGNWLLFYGQALDILSGGVTSVAKDRARRTAQSLAFEMFTDDPKAAQVAYAYFRAKFDGFVNGTSKSIAQLKNGDLIPFAALNEMGYTRAQVDALIDIAKNKNYTMQFRTTNTASVRHIRDGVAVPKPLDIKAKTINDIDVHLGYAPEHQGLVGMKNPAQLKSPDLTEPCIRQILKLCDAIKSRHKKRLDEYEELIKDFPTDEFEIKPDGRIFNTVKDKAVAGDIDPVSFKNKDGTFLSGDKYKELIDELNTSDAMIQHGAETNVVDDIMRHVDPDSPDYEAKLEKARKLQATLEKNHLDGSEMVIEFRSDGSIRKAILNELPNIDSSGNINGKAQVLNRALMERMFAGMGVGVRDALARGAADVLIEMAERRDAQAEQHADILRGMFPVGEMSSEEFGSLPALDFYGTCTAEPSGLNIGPASDTVPEGEDPAPILSEASIRDKLREAVGDEGLSEFRITANPDGSFTVFSREAARRTYDTTGDGNVSPLDALVIINLLNRKGVVQLDIWPTAGELRMDLSFDGVISPIDALNVINYLNRDISVAQGEGESRAGMPSIAFDYATGERELNQLDDDLGNQFGKDEEPIQDLAFAQIPARPWTSAVDKLFADSGDDPDKSMVELIDLALSTSSIGAFDAAG